MVTSFLRQNRNIKVHQGLQERKISISLRQLEGFEATPFWVFISEDGLRTGSCGFKAMSAAQRFFDHMVAFYENMEPTTTPAPNESSKV